jgi:hypothetical protein
MLIECGEFSEGIEPKVVTSFVLSKDPIALSIRKAYGRHVTSVDVRASHIRCCARSVEVANHVTPESTRWLSRDESPTREWRLSLSDCVRCSCSVSLTLQRGSW